MSRHRFKAPLTKSLAILILGLMLSTGCAPLITAEHERELGNRALHEIARLCPTSDDLAHMAGLVELAKQANAAKDPDRFWIAAAQSCPGLTSAQQGGYTTLVFQVRDNFNRQVYAVQYAEWQRRTGNIQQAGRVIMEAQRTDDLNRIRRDLQRYD